MSEDDFKRYLDKAVGPGRYRITSGYRTMAEDEALRRQGAGMTPRGAVSPHERGGPGDPGAYDIQPVGLSDAEFQAKLKGGPFANEFLEGSHGNQGQHFHVNMRPTDGVQQTSAHLPSAGDLLGPPPAESLLGPPPKGTQPTAQPKASPKIGGSVGVKAGEAKGQPFEDIVGDFKEAADPLGKLGKDVGGQIEALRKEKHGPGLIESAKNAGQIVGDVGGILAPGSALANTAIQDLGIRPAGAGEAALVNKIVPTSRPMTAEQGAQDVSRALLAGVPERGGVAGAVEAPRPEAVTTEPNLRPARPKDIQPPKDDPRVLRAQAKAALPKAADILGPKPSRSLAAEAEGGESVSAPLGKGDVVGHEADPVERVDNALYRLGGHATADKIEAIQALKAAPKEVLDPKVQEDLTHAVEQKMIDPNAEIPEHLQAAEAVRAPWAERQRVAVNNIRQMLADRGMTPEEIEDYMPDSGYVPRRVKGQSPMLDTADAGEGARNPLGFGKRGLSKSTGSLRARSQIVLEGEDGTRTFVHRGPENKEWRPGMEVRDPETGQKGTIKQATVREVEENGAIDSKGKPIEYHKNALVNTIDEALKSERVERNLQVLDEITAGMKEDGLAHRDEWHYKNDEGQWVRARANTERPEGFVELPNLPQLKGWSFDPKIAEVLKDYYPGPDEADRQRARHSQPDAERLPLRHAIPAHQERRHDGLHRPWLGLDTHSG